MPASTVFALPARRTSQTRKKPVQWEEAIKKLRGEFAANLVIQAFSDVMHQEVVVLTVHGVRRFGIIVILQLLPLLLLLLIATATTNNDDDDDDDDDDDNNNDNN